MLGWFRKKNPLDPEVQLKKLALLGFRPRPEIREQELVKFRKEAYIEKPYLLLMIALGSTAGDGKPVSERVWHVHRDSIRQQEDYAVAAMRMAAVAGSAGAELPIAAVESSLLHGGQHALLRFTLSGHSHEWELPRHGTAMDPAFLLGIADLLREQAGPRQYAYAALGGPDALIVCVTAGELDALNRLTELGFTWLAGSGFRF
jgi:hypothetical protein